jgi:hypothetical protein
VVDESRIEIPVDRTQVPLGEQGRRCYAGLDGPEFQAEVVRSIDALMPIDAVFFATADPATLLSPARSPRTR